MSALRLVRQNWMFLVPLLYTLIVIANSGEEDGGRRLVFWAALFGLALILRFQRISISVNVMTVLKFVHLLLAVVYLWGALFGKWAKRGDPDEGVFSADGGTGFGIIAVVLAVALVGLAIMRFMGRTNVLPGIGVEQLTVILGIAAWMNILAFVVGWLATFEAGTGWGVVVAYFPASIIPQLGMLTLSAAEPGGDIEELDDGRRRVFSLAAFVGGAGVALFPFLAWLTSGSVSLSALDGKSGGSLSGPRFGYILLIFGVVIAVGALMRLRPQGLAEPGPNALLSHVLLAGGVTAVLIPLATLISIMRLDIDVGAGIGLWLAFAAGAVLVVVAVAENRVRGAAAV